MSRIDPLGMLHVRWWLRPNVLLGVAGTIIATIAVANTAGVIGASNSIDDLRADNADIRQAAIELRQGLDQANEKLSAAGEPTVPVPVVIPTPRDGQDGAPGSPGAPGANGLNGLPGPAGPVGPTGAPGQPGDPGPTGQSGSNGANGADGAPGANGADGAPGPAGADGAAGPKGDPGPSGPAGAAGEPPVSWTFSILGVPYTCTRTDPFDPASPTYSCSAGPGDGENR